MNILYIVPYIPNPIRVRPYELVRTLVQRGHQVTLATLWSKQEEWRDLKILSDVGIKLVTERLAPFRSFWNCFRTLPSAIPLQAAYCWQPALAQNLRRLLNKTQFDIIHVEHLRGARYGLAVKEVISRQALPTPIIWDSVDCISHLFKQAAEQSQSVYGRWMARLDLNRTRRFEGQMIYQFDRVLSTSVADQQALQELAAQAEGQFQAKDRLARRFAVLPNGVNLTHFSPGDSVRQAHTIVFSGKMSYHANATAAHYLIEQIMPLVWARYPATEVQIVGKDPPASVRALASNSNSQNHHGKVIITGFVPEVYPYLQQATIAVAPVTYGAGVQNKVLEAMACGAPIVASIQAASGLSALTDQELVVANTPQEFSNAIVSLFDDPKQRQQLQQAGRAYVERCHSWDAITANLETIYQETINSVLNNSRVKS